VTRLVVDANVFASAAVGLPDSPSSRVLAAAERGEFELVVCDRILAEFQRTLRGRYFQARVPAEEGTRLDGLLRALAVILPDPTDPPSVVRDPRDDYLVALALAASVEAIVTGDKDLLDHAGLEPPAITPRTACERFRLA
jgi:hypothetical protein